MRRITVFLIAALGALSIAAYGLSDSKGEKDDTTMTRTFTVGNMVNGQFTKLGTLAFDDDHKGTLSLTGSSPDHQELGEAWNGIADLDVLHVRRSEPAIDEDGDEVIELIGVDIERSSEEYPEAVFEYLSWKFGFFGVEVDAPE